MNVFRDDYRSADPYPKQSRAMTQALDDAEDLRAPIAGMRTQIALLEVLVKQVQTAAAEDALNEAIGCLGDAISVLHVGADKVVDDCED